MSKYEKLWNYIVKQNKDEIKFTFGEIQNILGFKIDHSFLNYKKELLNYNYEVKKISLKNQEIIFKKINNKKQLLLDANVIPTPEIISDGLGSANKVYINFIVEIKEYGVSLMDWRYYNDGKAWLSKGEYKWSTSRGTDKVKPIFWLSIWEGFFKVSFFFAQKSLDELLALPISSNTKQSIRETVINGKPSRFIPVIFDIDKQEQLDDVYILIKLRKS